MARINSSATPAASSAEHMRIRPPSRLWLRIRQSWQLYVLLAIPLLYLLIFQYWPMYGAQIAFRNFNALQGITDNA